MLIDIDKVLIRALGPATFQPVYYDIATGNTDVTSEEPSTPSPPGHHRAAARRPVSNAGEAPLGVLPPRKAPDAPDRPPRPRYGRDLIIYEMHVRGSTQRVNSGVADAERGTFAGIVAKIPYLQRLGVTAVELLPVQQFDPQEGNYWGYMTLNFFSPHLSYGIDGSPEGAIADFKWMVDELHKAGIEVFLDVVYNHTTEMGVNGPTYCFRGIDNSSYYALDPGDLATYANYSACGNDLRTAHPVVRRLVVDSLRYWTREMGVDGFRFDLRPSSRAMTTARSISRTRPSYWKLPAVRTS